MITLEPYGNPFDAVDIYGEMERNLADLGLITCFEGRSPYGASYILFVMRADTQAGQRAAAVGRVARPLNLRRHDDLTDLPTYTKDPS